MIRVYFLILFRTLIAWFLYIFGLKGLSPKLYYASIYLFSKQSFRLPQSAKGDIGIVFKTYLNVVKDIFQQQPSFHSLSSDKVAVLDSSYSSENERVQYLNYFGVNPGVFLSRENISGAEDSIRKVLNFVLVTKLFSFFWLGSFSKNRVSYALLLKESVEWFNLIRLLKRNEIKRFYTFNTYEKDSNFMAYLLMKLKISVSKVTSEVPLTFANKIIITDELCLCSEYQKEEVKAFEKTMFYKTMQVWFPEMQITYLDMYKNKTFEIPVRSIGFYSSAFWLRKRRNHSIADVGSYDAEEVLLRYISDYLELHKDVSLVIFTHPYERNTKETYNEALEYYKNVLGQSNANRAIITGKETVSTLTFNKVNIGISLFSTIMFERMNLGFKIILAPLDKKDFPLEKSSFRNICAYSKEELFEKLDQFLPLDQKQFFQTNSINNYISNKVDVKFTLV